MNITRKLSFSPRKISPQNLSPRKCSKSVLQRSNVQTLSTPITLTTPIKHARHKTNRSIDSIHALSSSNSKETNCTPYKSKSPILLPRHYHKHSQRTKYKQSATLFVSPLATIASNLTSDRFIANRPTELLCNRYDTKSPEGLHDSYRKLLKNELLFRPHCNDSHQFKAVSPDMNHNSAPYHDYHIDNHEMKGDESNLEYYYQPQQRHKKHYQYNKGASPIKENDKLNYTPSSSPDNDLKNKKRIDCLQSPKRCLSFCNNDGSNNEDIAIKHNQETSTTPIRIDTQFEIFNLRNSKTNKLKQIHDDNIKSSSMKLNSNAYRVLDAPDLIDDFYSSVLDWNQNRNLIGVALADRVYIYHPEIGSVSCLVENTNNKKYFGNTCVNNVNPIITSLRFAPDGNRVAFGTDCGVVSIWDINKEKCVQYIPHMKDQYSNYHIGVLEWSKHWNHSCVVYGSKLKQNIHISDLRQEHKSMNKATQTINTPTKSVSLKWSPDGSKFAIGGRDRCVSIYDIRHLKSRTFTLKYHSSSIRAICWSPHNYNVLVSGGGALDKKICLWNLNTVNRFKNCNNYIEGNCITINKPIKYIRTSSQVCDIIWNPFKSDQILSTHGFVSNDINLWNINNDTKIKTLHGHKQRVLYVALSPNKKDIVTASNDETLRFWNVFCDRDENGDNKNNQLSGFGFNIR